MGDTDRESHELDVQFVCAEFISQTFQIQEAVLNYAVLFSDEFQEENFFSRLK